MTIGILYGLAILLCVVLVWRALVRIEELERQMNVVANRLGRPPL